MRSRSLSRANARERAEEDLATADPDAINDANLRALKGPKHLYAAKTVGASPKQLNDPAFQRAVASLDKDAPYRIDLELAVDAQVMLLHNLNPSAGLVNGSRGVVVDFDAAGLPGTSRK